MTANVFILRFFPHNFSIQCYKKNSHLSNYLYTILLHFAKTLICRVHSLYIVFLNILLVSTAHTLESSATRKLLLNNELPHWKRIVNRVLIGMPLILIRSQSSLFISCLLILMPITSLQITSLQKKKKNKEKNRFQFKQMKYYRICSGRVPKKCDFVKRVIHSLVMIQTAADDGVLVSRIHWIECL